MSSLGGHLRGIRESKGVPLDDVARATRVGRRHLEALEADDLADLPAPVFVKGFLRAYCDFLEVPPDEAFDLLRQATAEPVKLERGAAAQRPESRRRRAGPLLVSAALFLILGASLLALHWGVREPHRPAPSVQSAARVDAPPAASTAGATSAVQSAVRPPVPVAAEEAKPPAPATQRLLVRANEPTWLRVQVDDGQAAEELLQPGAVREWTAARRFVLTVGNAGGIELDLNGKRLPSIGPKGAVIQRLVLPQEAGTGGS